MTIFPNSSRLIKGALVGVDIFNPLASTVVFQHDPDTMMRRHEARAASGDGDRGEAQRLTGPPKETITLSIEIDATDQLEQANLLAVNRVSIPPCRRWKSETKGVGSLFIDLKRGLWGRVKLHESEPVDLLM